MTNASPRKKLLFFVELWREPPSGAVPASWRGIIKHIAHDDEHYIVQLSDITAFIASCAEAGTPPNGQ